jgi:hypothetical protein
MTLQPANQCRHSHMSWGLYIRNTTNRPRRTDGWPYSEYICGPGVLARCLKCSRCGHSVTAGPDRTKAAA